MNMQIKDIVRKTRWWELYDLAVAQVVLILLKVTGFLPFSWKVTLVPLWMVAAVFVIVAVAVELIEIMQWLNSLK